MTERKPFGVSSESWIDRQIREADERGELDNLPGEGKPLPDVGKPHDELWWIKDKMRSEGISLDRLLPTSLQLRKEIVQMRDTARTLRTEPAVREAVATLNERITAWLRAPSGPHVRMGLLDAEDVVAQWRADRSAAQHTTVGTSDSLPTTEEAPTARGKWWRRLLPVIW